MEKIKVRFKKVYRTSETSFNIQQSQPELSQHSCPALSFPDGVEVLHNCLSATVDICFIHGLTGDRDSTWTAKEQTTPWPKLLLPQKLDRARILTYGYDAYIARKHVAGSNRLIDHATNLLNDLTTDRALHNASSRPIIFVAHSLGGIVCKQAILRSRNNPDAHLRSIFNCTKGIIFMGTPHKGSWMADWARIPAKALGFVKSINKSLLEILETDNQLLEAIQVDFWSMIRELRESGRCIEVTCFFEEEPLPMVGKVVSKESATLEGYNSITIHANHSDMVRFSSADDNGFKRLLGELIRWESDQSIYILDDRDRQCIKDLWETDLENEKARIQQAKGGLLKDVYSWVLDDPGFQQWRNSPLCRLLWIRGDPGKGKTMLLCGIIDELKESIGKSGFLSFFFCQATDSRINNATAVLRGLIRQLIDQQPSLISYVRKKSDMYEDTNSWFAMSRILTEILEGHTLNSIFLAIDGLDECQDGLIELLGMIVQNMSSCSNVKWIVSSRNWPLIQERLHTASQLSLELNTKSVSDAVGIYVQHKVSQLEKLKKYDVKTQRDIQLYLSTHANGTFLWVALVCQRLEKAQWNPRAKLDMFPPGLDRLYGRMMKEVCLSEEAALCKQILGIATIVYRPITLRELASLMDPEAIADDVGSLEKLIGLCGSFLTLRDHTVEFVHQSAKDFLIAEAVKELFPFGMEKAHHAIFSRSLDSMKKFLQRDIYSLRAPGFPAIQIKRPEQDLLAVISYSCNYWVDHLCEFYSSWVVEKDKDLQDSLIIQEFVGKKYLQWLEALSLLRDVSKGVLSMSKLEYFVQEKSRGSQLDNLIRDSHRFIRYHKWAIENSPLQVYSSALVFCPTHSQVRILFRDEQPQWITMKPAMEDSWTACLQTLEGHGGQINSVVFSHDSTLLASAFHNKTVKVWDANNGQCLRTLEGHSNSVTSVIFSHDSKLLASASQDNTIKIWDANNGQCLQTLKGHSSPVNSIILSYNSIFLASASQDNTIKVWDTKIGQCLRTLKGHSHSVNAVIFSHDSTLIASASSDKTIKVWDTNKSQCLRTLEGHGGSVSSVIFSHDSTLLASACYKGTIRVWDAKNGQCLRTLEDHGGSVISVIFSHDSTLLASASIDNTAKVWNANNGQCLQTLEGHLSSVNSVTFSHDSTLLASASSDNTIKIWDTKIGQSLQMLEKHGGQINSVVFSHDSTLLASASIDNTIKVWDANNGQYLQTLQGHSRFINSVIFSYDSTLIISASNDKTIKVWDINNGQCLQTLEGHSHSVNAVIFSHSILIASASSDKTAKIWDVNGQCLQTLEGHGQSVISVIFSHDSKLLASASIDKTVKVWDINNGQCVHTLEGHGGPVTSVIFSHDSKLLASAYWNETVKVWNVSNGQCMQALNVRCVVIVKAFDNTNSYLQTNHGTIHLSLVSDIKQTETNLRRPRSEGYGLSSDRKWITWNSQNLLWLPPEYRPSTFVVALSTIAIGCYSGRVLLFKFDTQRLLHSLAAR